MGLGISSLLEASFNPIGVARRVAQSQTSISSQAPAKTDTENPLTKTTGFSKEGLSAAKALNGEGGQAPLAAGIESQLTEEEKHQVEELKKRDREVRAHENAHKAAAGHLAGPISFTFQTGPDGRRYAVGGEVPIKIPTGGGDPQSRLADAQRVQQAARAPADPSAQDNAVAAQASRAAAQARQEISEERQNELQENGQTTPIPANINEAIKAYQQSLNPNTTDPTGGIFA